MPKRDHSERKVTPAGSGGESPADFAPGGSVDVPRARGLLLGEAEEIEMQLYPPPPSW